MEAVKRLALLIDADNAQASLLPQMLAEISKYGNIIIRRIYGDWTTPNLKPWKETLNAYAIYPMQQFSYTKGKNSTDSALIIDAMDILYTANVDGFCIVSSDSDFIRLATRIREKDLFVMGIGMDTTPRAFVNACSVFVFTNILKQDTESLSEMEFENSEVSTQVIPEETGSNLAQTENAQPEPFEEQIKRAFDQAVQDNGWASLALVGDFLRRNNSGFDPRQFGQKLLSKLILEYPNLIEVKKERKNQNDVTYIRLKQVTE